LKFGKWRTGGTSRAVSTAIRIGGILILVGGVIMLVLGVIQFIGAGAIQGLLSSSPRLSGLRLGLVSGAGVLIDVIGGIIAIVGSRHPGGLVWSIVLIILGLIVGGWGGILVLAGAIIALVARHI